MDTRWIIHRLLEAALDELHHEGAASGLRATTALADLMRPVPRNLEDAAIGHATYEDALDRLYASAAEKGDGRWVSQTVEHVGRWDPALEARGLLYRLLYEAFLQMRVEAYEQHASRAFALADTIINVPLELEASIQGRQPPDDILASIQTRAQHRQCLEWLDQTLRAIAAPA